MDSLMVHRVEAIVGMIEALIENVDLDEYDEFSERSSLGYTVMTGLSDIVDLAKMANERPLWELVEHGLEKQEWEPHELPRFGRKNWRAAPDQRGGWYVCSFEDLSQTLEDVKAYFDRATRDGLVERRSRCG